MTLWGARARVPLQNTPSEQVINDCADPVRFAHL
jgi:hypothetical protein